MSTLGITMVIVLPVFTMLLVSEPVRMGTDGALRILAITLGVLAGVAAVYFHVEAWKYMTSELLSLLPTGLATYEIVMTYAVAASAGALDD